MMVGECYKKGSEKEEIFLNDGMVLHFDYVGHYPNLHV